MIGSILIVKNNFEFDLELQNQLEARYFTCMAQDVEDAIDMIEDTSFDAIIIMLETDIDVSTWDLVDRVQRIYENCSAFIFMAKNASSSLQSTVYRGMNWNCIPFSINQEDFVNVCSKAINLAQRLYGKTIVLEQKRQRYEYNVNAISRIERSGDRKIKISGQHSRIDHSVELEFTFNGSLQKFIEEYGVGDKIKQAHKSWLVNMSYIKSVDPTGMLLYLDDGTVVMTSRKFIDEFRVKKQKKED